MTSWRNNIVGSGIVKAGSLLGNEQNWRIHPKLQQDALGSVLASVGWVQNIIVNKRTSPEWGQNQNVETVVDGHLRAMMAISKGEDTEVPVVYVDLSPEEEKLILVSLDPLSAMAAADRDKLTDLMRSIETENAEVRRMLEAIAAENRIELLPPQEDPEPQIDKADELQRKWGTILGQVWEIPSKTAPGKAHHLMCGDSTKAEDVARLMQGEKAAMVFTDPPYGVSIVSTHKTKGSIGFGGKLGFVGADGMVPVNAYSSVVGDDSLDAALKHYMIVKDLGCPMLFWGGNYMTAFLPPSPCWIVWDKREGIPSNNFADCEIAWTSFDKPSRLYRHLWSGLLRKGDRNIEGFRRMHPTQKPAGLFQNILADFTQSGNMVFDGFLGSGTTMVAAEQLGRLCYGMEIHPPYIAVSLQRMADMGLEPRLEVKGGLA